MEIFITGATGFIGSYLRTMLLRQGHFLTIVTRNPASYENEKAKNQRFISWDDDLVTEMDKSDVVINLAGAPIFGRRWTQQVKEQIYNSRIERTADIAEAIVQAKNPPELFISGSAAGFYGDRGDKVIDESVGSGSDFLARVCIDWEASASPAADAGVRLVHPRIGIALEQEGGALKQMLPAFKFGVGGPVGTGKQFFPWIHMHDLCRGLIFPIDNHDLEGAYNLNAPNPVRMKKFANILAEQLRRPALFRVPEFVLKLVFGEAANPIVNSLRLQPKKLQQHGFEFRFSHLPEALGDIL
ncbi:hypothetical protein LX73_2492 [Fodinibius salinus]|uniref:TIGR01777 family protein n=1 Tax=Fodinibius salinus TaxID=860790 RepID=A0A5D3YFK2_9BACT|nr:TIGR01777 family oxidoreductase [Fodinibius salinus]TYP91668.1 hypothetical protein LX73_2492 [Fodinibius salinus]